MATISNLPTTEEELNKFSLDMMVLTIMEMIKPETRILGEAGLQINTFLSLAAVRLAKEYKEKIIEGEGYYVNTNGGDF